MIKSMTGYGRARKELHKRDITVEVRSVNNRYLDCTVKMPRMYGFAEGGCEGLRPAGRLPGKGGRVHHGGCLRRRCGQGQR